jgi:hypothetical protein
LYNPHLNLVEITRELIIIHFLRGNWINPKCSIYTHKSMNAL